MTGAGDPVRAAGGNEAAGETMALHAVTLEGRMDRMLEVRVRTGIPLWWIGIAGLGLGMATGAAQTEAPQPTANPAPAAQTAPAPTPERPDKTSSAPAYGG